MRGYFEGWYFRQQAEQGTVALIPSLHTDQQGRRSAMIQVVTADAAYCAAIPADSFRAGTAPFHIALGGCTFGAEGICLDIRTDGLCAQGRLAFGPLSPVRYDIMGPFRFVPNMECRHSVFSMAHEVTGNLRINGKEYLFENALGYIEGDKGRSFPSRYMWTQAAWRGQGLCSLVLSVADIPFAMTSFTGVIGVVLLDGQEYRLATYLGARAACGRNGEITVRQGKYAFSAKRLDSGDVILHAPSLGSMSRRIREAPSCRVRYRLSRDGETLLDRTQENAGFEWEYEK